MGARRYAFLSTTARTKRRTRIVGILHDGRHRDAQDRQGTDQFAAGDRDGGQKELLSLLIRLAEDGMAMIEGVKKLRELEDMLGQVCRFCSGDALVDDIARFGG